MAQHFLLSAKARTLSLAAVARLTEAEARATFRAIRWHATGGDPVCPRCGCLAVYEYRARQVFKCKACGRQFSVTSGTIFHSRKLSVRDHLLAIAIFVNGAKGVSALQLGRDLDVSYKTAFVLAHKLREAMSADQAKAVASGHVEIDGAYFGGHVKPANHKENRRDRRLAVNQTGKRKVVVVMRERGGRTLPFVVRAEDEGVATVARASPRAARSTPTRRRTGIAYTPASTPGGSTTASRSATTRPAKPQVEDAKRAILSKFKQLLVMIIVVESKHTGRWRNGSRRGAIRAQDDTFRRNITHRDGHLSDAPQARFSLWGIET
jgi:transposase-like protein